MSELLHLVSTPWPLLFAILIFGFAPTFCLRLIVHLYPRDHPRRRELVAELYVIPRRERPFWVADALATGVFDGLNARRLARRNRGAKQMQVAGTAEAMSLAETLTEALLSLPPRQRKVLQLEFMEGLPRQEVASCLGVGEVQVAALRASALKQLSITESWWTASRDLRDEQRRRAGS